MVCVIGAILYYGWPIIEALIHITPLPDTGSMQSTAKSYGNQAMELVKNVPGMLHGETDKARAPGYQ